MVALVFPLTPRVAEFFTATNNVIYQWNGVTWIVIGNANQGNYILPVASTSVLGGVQVDGSTITVDGNGVIRVSGNDISYTASTPSNWSSTPPTTIKEAIDRLAAAFKIANGIGA